MSHTIDCSDDRVTAVACTKCGSHCVAVFAQDITGETQISAYCAFCEVHVSLAAEQVAGESCVISYIN